MAAKTTVGDYVTLQRGLTYKGNLVGKPGPALLGLGSIRPGGGFREGDYKTYGGECPAKLMLFPGDLFVSLKGATKDGEMIGSVARVPDSVPTGRLTQDTVGLKFLSSDRKLVSFLYWILRTPQYRDYCSGRATGSAVVALSRDDFLDFPVPEPTSFRQRIVQIFDNIEEKIELNRRMNATLEATARTLFQSWFVDFAPVRAKASVLIAEGVLEIGDGYRAKNSELGPEGLPFVRAGDLDAGFDLDGAEKLCPESVAKAPTKISQPGDIAFTSKGTVGRIARVAYDSPRFVYAPQVCYWRTKSVESVHPAILYSWMAFGDFNSQVLSYAGQTDMAPYISLRDQREIMVPRFPDSQREIGDQIEALLTMKATNMKQSRTLAALRDTLLPKLLSGELSVASRNGDRT